MDQKEVTAQVPEKKDAEGIVLGALGPVTVVIDFPETYEEAIGWCGEEAMLSNAFANYKVSPVQSLIRAGLRNGMSAEQIQDEADKLVMGIARVGGKVDTKAAYVALFKRSTPEIQAEMLEDLRAQAQE